MKRRCLFPLLSAVMVLAALGCRGPAGSGDWRWDRKDGSSLALVGPAGTVWQFHFAEDGDHAYFHPLSTTDGRLLTWDRPPDHIWHHGLWFGWKYINKVNYWEVDRATGRPAGRTAWTNDRYRGRHIALDYSGLVGGAAAGIAIVDHPANPRSPTPWYVIDAPGFGWFTPALLCYEPMALRKGETLVLRYRVLVHPGRWDAERLRTEAERFAGGGL